MDGYHNSETFMSDLNALIYGHQMKMAGIFAKRDVVSKLLHEQITLCDSLAKSILTILNHRNQVFKILWRQWLKGNILRRN